MIQRSLSMTVGFRSIVVLKDFNKTKLSVDMFVRSIIDEKK